MAIGDVKMKNHMMVDGQLLQTNKKYSQLKQKQKQKISSWMYEATKEFYDTHHEFPTDKDVEAILDKVYEQIEAENIWIPYGEVAKHYRSRRAHIHSRIRKAELPQNTKNHMQNVDYNLLLQQLEALAESDGYFIPLMANASALLYENLPKLNWAGFYIVRDDRLVLGPFQGKVACIHIESGKGVCGTAFAENQTQLVANVHEFPGHIACDSASNSEIVVPIHGKDGSVVAVLDIDSPILNRFTEEDKEGLEDFVQVIEKYIVGI